MQGYYQPAGPLISSHLVQQSQQGSTKSIPSPLDSDSVQLQQPPPSTSAAESSDSEVLITGGDLTPRPQTFRYAPQGPGPYSRPIHQMHCPTYPPASYYATYSQHPQDMCYSPPYQPYYPSKVYPASYRRYVTGSYYQPTPSDMYDPPPPSSAPPPPSGTQIVPAGPSGPQHIDHYPPYYSGYSPGGGQCYSRSMQPPYMDAPPYPNSCPCPMQSCPKNVHTGPLIGNKTGKGPVQSNHISSVPTSLDSLALQPANLVAAKMTCKTEDGPVIIKPEANDAHLYIHSVQSQPPDVHNLLERTRDKPYEQIVHAPHPNFTLNPKILEPETPISPARGSIGLPMPPTQDSATQPIVEMPPVIRRARVGKTMAREMMMMPHYHHINHSQTIFRKSDDPLVASSAEQTELIDMKPVDLIKKEDVKVEKDDDVVFLEKCELHTKPLDDRISEENRLGKPVEADNNNKRKSSEPDIISIDDSLDDCVPLVSGKKRKILELNRHVCKKSPPNSYKTLIKQSEPKSYLTNTDRRTPLRSRFRVIRNGSRYTNQPRKMINRKHKRVMITSSRKIRRRICRRRLIHQENRRSKEMATSTADNSLNPNGSSKNEINLEIKVNTPEISNEKTEEKRSFMTSLELTADSTGFKQSSIKAAFDSKLSMDGKCQKQTQPKSKKNSCSDLNHSKEPCESNIGKDLSKSRERKSVVSDISNGTNGLQMADHTDKDECKKTGKKCTKTKKTTKAQESLLDDTNALLDNDSINNNNHIIPDHNYQPHHHHHNHHHNHNNHSVKTTTTKKAKSRASKFGSKKRHRVRHVREVEEIIIPRKSTAPPRWSNGWNWIGQPFQGKVFLNSDDPQVVRTRYSAMEHDSGDVIQPGDCVLLKAGSKKNELPYVAKVASLWENPEDGEMMMSLLWYYRPEHTEQGRQPIDCADEVFASKHQDHNSVACIEDKCYVLTFNEYCRYRKTIKALEEGIEEPLPVAPFNCSYSTREVPNNASSELIFFCRRVYEFRLKRLIKNPT